MVADNPLRDTWDAWETLEGRLRDESLILLLTHHQLISDKRFIGVADSENVNSLRQREGDAGIIGYAAELALHYGTPGLIRERPNGLSAGGGKQYIILCRIWKDERLFFIFKARRKHPCFIGRRGGRRLVNFL